MEFIIKCFEVGVILKLIVVTWLREFMEFMELLYSVFRGQCFHSYFMLRHGNVNNNAL